MRTFGFALAAVLCTIQLAVALPRPDFGISLDVFSADKTDAIASAAAVLLDDLWNTDPKDLTSGYPTLTNLETEVNTIGEDFSGKVETLLEAISDLATADSDIDNSFGAVTNAITSLETYVESDVTTNYDNLDDELYSNEIVTMLEDAFGEVSDSLYDLSYALNEIKSQLDDALIEAEGSVTKIILREYLSPSDTTALTNAVLELKADLPLVFYILMKSKDLLKEADEYILEAGDAASSAVEYIDEGLSALVDEIDYYYSADDGIVETLGGIIDYAAEPNLDFSNVDMSGITAVSTETGNFDTTYGASLTTALQDIQQNYNDYKAAIPDVSDGYSDFYQNEAFGHVINLVTVLINFGPYAEYCFNKYRDEALALFEVNARNANECVDREITRLLKLQEVLIYIAETLVFSIEDLLDTVEACSAQADACNDSDIATYLGNLNTVVEDTLLGVMVDIVDYETDAGLARLEACFTANKYSILDQVDSLQFDIFFCEEFGPNSPGGILGPL